MGKSCNNCLHRFRDFQVSRFYRNAEEKGKNCGTCRHSYMRHHMRSYRKCKLMGTNRSPGRDGEWMPKKKTASDVSRRKVCDSWEEVMPTVALVSLQPPENE